MLVVYVLRANCHSTCGLVAMTSASHAEGRQFDPGQVYVFFTVGPIERRLQNLRRVWITILVFTCTCGLVAMTSAQHAEGRQFDPGQVYFRCAYLCLQRGRLPLNRNEHIRAIVYLP